MALNFERTARGYSRKTMAASIQRHRPLLCRSWIDCASKANSTKNALSRSLRPMIQQTGSTWIARVANSAAVKAAKSADRVACRRRRKSKTTSTAFSRTFPR